MNWHGQTDLPSHQFRCGFCGNIVATDKGFINATGRKRAYPCPHCDNPSYFDENGNQFPGVAPGNDVKHLPKELEAIYIEARHCVSVNAFTASVLACRKMLMHIAVEQKADPGKAFIYYVEFLANNGYVPPNGKGWVDYIRKKGNEATHEIVLMEKNDALKLISFAEMLPKFIYEFPAQVPAP